MSRWGSSLTFYNAFHFHPGSFYFIVYVRIFLKQCSILAGSNTDTVLYFSSRCKRLIVLFNILGLIKTHVESFTNESSLEGLTGLVLISLKISTPPTLYFEFLVLCSPTSSFPFA